MSPTSEAHRSHCRWKPPLPSCSLSVTDTSPDPLHTVLAVDDGPMYRLFVINANVAPAPLLLDLTLLGVAPGGAVTAEEVSAVRTCCTFLIRMHPPQSPTAPDGQFAGATAEPDAQGVAPCGAVIAEELSFVGISVITNVS